MSSSFKSLVELTPQGQLRFNFHPGQWRAWESKKRFVLNLAGVQSGKTESGPPWLLREMQLRGPGDYLIAAPTYPLLEKKVLPVFRRLFVTMLRLGSLRESQSPKFTLSPRGAQHLFGKADDGADRTTVFFGHADDPDSLESATLKAAWLDEAGQKKFKLESWEAIQRRLSIHQGRVLMTTAVYNLGWLKMKIHDPWKAAGGNHPDIDVVRFKSIDNPAFPLAEYERAKRELPEWKFRMFYDAIFSRPAGLIYDCFDEAFHVVPQFNPPSDWKRYLGLDFGGVNTAGVFFAEEPGPHKRLFAYREYKAGSRTAREHANKLKEGEPLLHCVGGSKSEGQWRDEFRAGGLSISEPDITEVEVGIDRVYAAIKKAELFVMDHLHGLLDELFTYSRELDANGDPTEDIEDKQLFHYLDSVRYIISKVKLPFVHSGRMGAGQNVAALDAPPGTFGNYGEYGKW